MTQNHADNRVGSIPTGGTKIPIANAIGIFYIFSLIFLLSFLSMLYKINIPVNPMDTEIVVIIQTGFYIKKKHSQKLCSFIHSYHENLFFYITALKKFIHLSLFVLAKISSGVPSSTMYPPSMKITLSETSFANPIS